MHSSQTREQRSTKTEKNTVNVKCSRVATFVKCPTKDVLKFRVKIDLLIRDVCTCLAERAWKVGERGPKDGAEGGWGPERWGPHLEKVRVRRAGSHGSPRAQTCTYAKLHEKTPERKKKEAKMEAGEEKKKKKREILGGPAEGRAGTHPTPPHPTPPNPTPLHPTTMAKREIGQKKTGQKMALPPKTFEFLNLKI